MTTIYRLLTLIVLAGVTVACGGSAAAPAPTVKAAAGGVCAPLEGGLSFTTAASSCEQARVSGKQLAVSLGLATPEGAELIFSSMCDTIQGSVTMTYHDDADLQLAKQLDASGVCPGDVSMLVHV